jgi:hypothetical protein
LRLAARQEEAKEESEELLLVKADTMFIRVFRKDCYLVSYKT